jgi:hypothetical protein
LPRDYDEAWMDPLTRARGTIFCKGTKFIEIRGAQLFRIEWNIRLPRLFCARVVVGVIISASIVWVKFFYSF